MSDYNENHSTQQEKEFLNGLGGWSKHVNKPEGTGMTKEELLQSYLVTMHLRQEWGSIDKVEVKRYVRFLLRQE